MDKTVSINDVEKLSVLPNTKIPKGMMVYLYGKSTDGFNNWQFVIDLYREVHKINLQEKLKPTIGKSVITKDDRYNQEVTLVVMYDKGKTGDYLKLIQLIKNRLSLELGTSFNGNLFIAPLETDLPNGRDLWVQDFGEFALANLKGVSDPVYMVIDVNRNKNRNAYNPEVFRDLFGIPLVKMGQDANNSSQYGGNIEATADGILYMGNSVDDASYSAINARSELFENLKDKGNPNAIKISSDWLAVGHVDEYMTIIPSKNKCSSALIYGSPLLGFKTILENTRQSPDKC